jgi:hypothetical protein
MTRFVLLLIFLLVASSAKAQIPQTSNLTGNWLYTVCAASDQQGQVICRMWISGFQVGIISSQNLAQVNKLKPASCIPHDVTADQVKLIIEKFLRDNPQYMQLSAEMVASDQRNGKHEQLKSIESLSCFILLTKLPSKTVSSSFHS